MVTDITQRIQAEEALQASEAKYKTLVETSPDTVVLADLQGNLTFVSHGILELHGSENLEEFIGKHPVDFIVQEDHQRFLANFKRTLEEGVTRNIEYTFVRKDGSRFPGEVSGTVIRDAEGKPTALMAIVRDITERKRALEALVQSERALQEAQHLAQVGSWELDTETGTVTWTEELYRITGRDLNSPAPHYRVHPELLTPESWQRLEVAVRELSESGTVYELDLEVVRPDQTRRWVVARGERRYDANGHVVGLRGTVQDLTERHQAQEALRQSHGELRTIYDGMPDGVLVADIETKKFVRCNAAVQQMLGYSEDELLSRSVMDIHPAAEMSRVLEMFHALVDGGQRVGQGIPVLRSDGSVFHVDVTHSEITFNGRQCSVGFFRDITEGRQAQEALRQLSDRLSLATKAAHVGIWDLDIPNNKLVWDDSMFRLYGITPNEFGGAYEAWQAGVHPEDQARADTESQMARRGEKEYDTEFRVVWPDKSVHWIKANAMVQHDALGKAVRMLGTNWDITERKRAEEALRQSHDELQAIYDQVVDGIVIVDIEKPHPIRANAAICRMLGYSEEEMKTLLPSQVHPPEAMPKILEHLQAVSQRACCTVRQYAVFAEGW